MIIGLIKLRNVTQLKVWQKIWLAHFFRFMSWVGWAFAPVQSKMGGLRNWPVSLEACSIRPKHEWAGISESFSELEPIHPKPLSSLHCPLASWGSLALPHRSLQATKRQSDHAMPRRLENWNGMNFLRWHSMPAATRWRLMIFLGWRMYRHRKSRRKMEVTRNHFWFNFLRGHLRLPITFYGELSVRCLIVGLFLRYLESFVYGMLYPTKPPIRFNYFVRSWTKFRNEGRSHCVTLIRPLKSIHQNDWQLWDSWYIRLKRKFLLKT